MADQPWHGDEPQVLARLRRVLDGDASQADEAVVFAVDAGHALGLDRDRLRALVEHRLRLGARRYGPLSVHADPRDWRGEAREEVADLIVYAINDAIRGRRR